MPQETVKIISVKQSEKWASDEQKSAKGYKPEMIWRLEAVFPQTCTFDLPHEVASVYEDLVGQEIVIPYFDGITKKGDNYRKVNPEVTPIIVGRGAA